MVNVVRGNVHMEDAKLVYQKGNQVHFVIDMKIVQEKEKRLVVSGELDKLFTTMVMFLKC